MTKQGGRAAGLAIIATCLAASATAAPEAPAGPAKRDPQIMRVQVLLDRLGYSPGVIDGLGGQSLAAALKGFQDAKGLKVTGEIDAPTRAWLARFNGMPTIRTLRLTRADLAGPYSGRLPKEPEAQAKLPALGYMNVVEALAERFHTTPATLVALNPGAKLTPGVALRFPNTLPVSRDYPAALPEEWRRTLSSLNISARQPKGDRIVVDKSDGVLRVYDKADRLIAQFPATMGSRYDPLPIGNWKIVGAAYNPTFHYNPDLFWDADSKDEKARLPAGPNSPVGVVWLDLNKPHYGIHGTPNPNKIGRTESHGCIRLTNWDAARLALMVGAGTPARFQE